MALPSPPSDASSPPGPLRTLYPLACMLVGPEEAPDLLLRVYQQAAARPPAERPDTPEEWLLALVRAVNEEATSDPEPASPPEPEGPPTDPLRQEVAEQRAEEALPVALAACSPAERFLLAVDAVGEAEGSRAASLARALDTTPADARAALWTQLKAVLSGPEGALVQEALSDEVLRDAVREWVASRYSPVPRSLRSQIRETVDAAEAPAAPGPEDDSSPSEASLLDDLPTPSHPRAVLFTLLIGAMVLAGGIGVWYATQSSPAPSSPNTSLIAFSAERAESVGPDLITSSPSKAEAYVQSTWSRQIDAPVIRDARLHGVGRVRAAGDTEIPVLLYADTTDDARIATFAYSYALVDRISTTATLDTGIREELARRNHLVADSGASRTGLLWRDRDDIFVAVSPSIPADSLRARLRP